MGVKNFPSVAHNPPQKRGHFDLINQLIFGQKLNTLDLIWVFRAPSRKGLSWWIPPASAHTQLPCPKIL